MTDEQIIKALEHNASKCKFYEDGHDGGLFESTLDLINLQKIKNEEELRTAKSEAIKEFAERLKRKIWHSGWCNLEMTITPEIITNLVKEMTEVQK